MRGPIFILVTHFTTKLKFIAFLNKRGKISPLKFESNFITHVTEDENWAVLGYYTASSGKKLPLLAAQYPRRAQFSATSWRKPEIAHVTEGARMI
jgi:hypothetical protein